MSTATEAGGFRFTAPNGGTVDAPTDENGSVTLEGYLRYNHDLDEPVIPQALVEYNDGTLVQKLNVALTSPTTAVEFKYMPWLAVTTDHEKADIGKSVSIGFRVRQVGASPLVEASEQAGAARAHITIQPPQGSKPSTCHRREKLHGATSASGTLHLRVCASRSGIYTISSHGAVPVAPLMLLVKGAPPLSPRDATARSYAPGQSRLTWAVPAYAGGAKVTAYKITATSEGRKSRHFVTHGKRKLTVTGLHRFSKWTFHIRAVTRNGISESTVVTDWVS